MILVNGASGSVGSAAVQIARHVGAIVTAVCSGANHDLVRDLSAAKVIDYAIEDFTHSGQTYDVIFFDAGRQEFVRPLPRLSRARRDLPDHRSFPGHPVPDTVDETLR